MRPIRLILALVVAAGLGPSLWVRSPVPEEPDRARPVLTRITIEPAHAGPFRLDAAWRITGEGRFFGGFSALAAASSKQIIAASDTGYRLVIDLASDGRTATASYDRFGADSDAAKVAYDLESLTRDPATGNLWGAYEGSNGIRRFGPDLRPLQFETIPAMRGWGDNSGAEAFTRLPDGKFFAIEERAKAWGSNEHRALLFPGDPLLGAQPRKLFVGVPGNFRPVDAIAIDHTRLLILLRDVAFGFPPRFETAIAFLDLAAASEGLDAEIVAHLGEGFPHDNYEGMAITDDADGRFLWLISDDNGMTYQNSYLLRLRWPDERKRQKARE